MKFVMCKRLAVPADGAKRPELSLSWPRWREVAVVTVLCTPDDGWQGYIQLYYGHKLITLMQLCILYVYGSVHRCFY